VKGESANGVVNGQMSLMLCSATAILGEPADRTEQKGSSANGAEAAAARNGLAVCMI